MRPEATSREDDLKVLTMLNQDYLHSDQNNDVARFDQFLAPEFTASLPGNDYQLLNRGEFLNMIAKPRPFTDLQCHDLDITILGDVALVHARMSVRTLKGELKHGRYTDEYQRRNGEWLCIGANVIGEPL